MTGIFRESDAFFQNMKKTAAACPFDKQEGIAYNVFCLGKMAFACAFWGQMAHIGRRAFPKKQGSRGIVFLPGAR